METDEDWKYKSLENIIGSVFLNKDLSRKFALVRREAGSCWATIEYKCDHFSLIFHDDKGVPMITLEKREAGIYTKWLKDIKQDICTSDSIDSFESIHKEFEYLLDNYTDICNYFDGLR